MPVGQTSAMTLGANTVDGYVTNAAMGDMYEIRAAEMALERSQNAEVRALAQTILDDHTAASEALRNVVMTQQIDVEMPTELDERRCSTICGTPTISMRSSSTSRLQPTRKP